MQRFQRYNNARNYFRTIFAAVKRFQRSTHTAHTPTCSVSSGTTAPLELHPQFPLRKYLKRSKQDRFCSSRTVSTFNAYSTHVNMQPFQWHDNLLGSCTHVFRQQTAVLEDRLHNHYCIRKRTSTFSAYNTYANICLLYTSDAADE